MSRPSLLFVVLTLGGLSVWWTWTGSRAVNAEELRPGWTRLMRGDEAGTLAGRLLVDEGIPPRRLNLSIEARLPGEDVPALRHLPIEVAEDGTFFSPALPACVSALSIRLGEVELARIEELHVPPSGACPDPRLEKVDLRGKVSLFSFELFDFAGDPVPFATLGWRPAAPEGDERPYRDVVIARRGRAEIVCAEPWIDLLVAAPGARTREVFGVSFGRELHLREGWPVRLALPEALDPVADGVDLSVRLVRIDAEPRVDPDAERLLEAVTRSSEVLLRSGETEVVLPSTGTWELEWIALVETPIGLRRLDLGSSRPVLSVGGDDWQVLQRPTFPLEAYRAALAD